MELLNVLAVGEYSWPEPRHQALAAHIEVVAERYGYQAQLTPAYHGEADLVFVSVTRKDDSA